LSATQAVFDENGNNEPELLEHQAYLTERYAAIAVSQAQAARLGEEIENADAERSRVLLEARRAEAARAEAGAARAEAGAASAEALAAARGQQARAAQAQATGAEARAQDLQSRLEALQAEQTERGIVLTLGDVLFDTDRAELKPGADSTISELAAFLGEYEGRTVLIEGYTDSTGSDEYNRMLSERRANAVRDALLERGVAFDRIHTRGLGEDSPVASNDAAAGRQQNRRVEVVISDENGQFAR
jgi:outer membrane protein OmpA-like peptidoglycan-associated protein